MNGKEMFIEFVKLQLKRSGYDVFAPKEMLNKRAEQVLSPEGYDLWCDIQIALTGLNDEDKREFAKLIVHQLCRIFDIMDNVRIELLEETKETLDFLQAHPECKEEGSTTSPEDVMNFFSSFDDDKD